MKSKCCNKEIRVDRNMLSYTQEEVSEDVGQLADDLINHAVNRFCSWSLPKDFHPDGGIEFEKEYNISYNEKQGKPPSIHEPIGTNLFTANQAKEMLRFLFEDGDGNEIIKQALTTAYEAGKIDGINDIRERNYLVRREDKMYVQDCIATDNRDWIEPHIRAVAKAEMKGARSGYSQGYEAGLKENKILPENCK